MKFKPMQGRVLRQEDARTVQSFGAWRCLHWGASAANAAPLLALVFFVADPRPRSVVCAGLT
jgi:hypothetical protein